MIFGLLPRAAFLYAFLSFSVLMPIGLVYLFRLLWDRKSFGSLGIGFETGWAGNLVIGLILGAGLIGLVFLIHLLTGWAVLVEKTETGTSASFFAFLAPFFLVGLGVAFSEELTFRGYVLQNLSEDWGVPVGVLLSSFLFGYAHFLNPSFSLITGLNLTLAGVLFAYAYLVSGSLWLPIGLHFAWNFFEGFVFGFPVSGVAPGLSLLSLKTVGPAIATGGQFGPEGGLVALAVYIAGLIVLRAIRSARAGKRRA